MHDKAVTGLLAGLGALAWLMAVARDGEMRLPLPNESAPSLSKEHEPRAFLAAFVVSLLMAIATSLWCAWLLVR